MTIRTAGRLAEEKITHAIIAAFFEVYNKLGFGFLESVYAEALTRELRRRGHRVEREVLVKVWYKGEIVARHRADMVVDGRVIVEIKSGVALHPTGSRQLYNYLRGTDLEVGLLLHFGPEPRYYREYVPNSRKSRPDTSVVTASNTDPLVSPGRRNASQTFGEDRQPESAFTVPASPTGIAVGHGPSEDPGSGR